MIVMDSVFCCVLHYELLLKLQALIVCLYPKKHPLLLLEGTLITIRPRSPGGVFFHA